jgi:hypothetical protein
MLRPRLGDPFHKFGEALPCVRVKLQNYGDSLLDRERRHDGITVTVYLIENVATMRGEIA